MKRVYKRGTDRMKELGRKTVACWFALNDYEAIVTAAKKLGLPVSTYVKRMAVIAARGGDPYTIVY